jgi:hypothetical protein
MDCQLQKLEIKCLKAKNAKVGSLTATEAQAIWVRLKSREASLLSFRLATRKTPDKVLARPRPPQSEAQHNPLKVIKNSRPHKSTAQNQWATAVCQCRTKSMRAEMLV